ncbi:class I SAM-dependent methyltransferase [Spirosoma foliorum]|uniref:Class I SAM-dependent methyltransferase n=1 Tax=Spirosoma foliorum TaxID=2710596 RepID=A0A7G5GU52_9BACT|nr:class I SAM-dependent methyltransferase [Spirosoma foliorum]QMW02394.1 class I SAM-dependent methyltransferase [Spirosoma foliorum]
MKCRICESETSLLFQETVLNKYKVGYYECPTCDFVQTETPYWLDEAYSQAFTSTDTGTLQRSLILGKSTIALAFFAFDRHARFIDYAGGYGTLTRYMRDVGFDFYSTDLYATNFMARGFDAKPGRYELATAFECFEHFVYPGKELEKILDYSDSIFFTTQPRPKPAPAIKDWWYYAPHHGQHIALYRPKTLAFLGRQYGLNYYNLLNYHLLSKRKLSPFVFKFLVIAGRLGLSNVVSLFLKSRTLSDADLLKKHPSVPVHVS